ncbi:jg3432 [Pararge aegeria aegeria]|uniref:Jg3432 protein n=1 Tax=Pararge aegeria aegeria TaxID=348720 RepID=A0A8S4RR95_9NEOP|nr:jg3432 [Pararge aegeria aegeria]
MRLNTYASGVWTQCGSCEVFLASPAKCRSVYIQRFSTHQAAKSLNHSSNTILFSLQVSRPADRRPVSVGAVTSGGRHSFPEGRVPDPHGPPSSPGGVAVQRRNAWQASRLLLEETLARPGTPPTIVQPPNGGYWVEGGEDSSADEESEPRPQPGTPRQSSRKHNIDTDDTATFYRRFFYGKVSSRHL